MDSDSEIQSSSTKQIENSKLQHSPNNENNDNSNIPSSIVSAFSSFSSFTSSFTLNNSSTVNNNLTIDASSTSTKASQGSESKVNLMLKRTTTERKNLIALTKLIVKDLISSSLNVGRTIDDCQNAVHLENYFTLIDKVLKHGLKQNLLSNRSSNLWNALDNLPKYLKESTLMSESIRSLSTTKTPDGKIKAWMRLAMMQKKLPEYFNELLANKDVLLKDIYHDYALMLNDEAYVFAGLIIGVNVIDCNFFVKNANFDMMDDIIDLGPYLRTNSVDDGDDYVSNETGFSIDESVNGEQASYLNNMKVVLDQKCYLEERNKMLETNILNLQVKINNLEEQNSKLEMEAKVYEVRLTKLQEKCSDVSNDRQTISTPITDVIKNMIGNNEQTTKSIEISNSISRKLEPMQRSELSANADIDNQAAQIESIVSHDSATTTTDTNFDVTCNKLNDYESPVTSLTDKQSSTKGDCDNLRKIIEKQEKDLSSLQERTTILETSYRGALEKIKVLERDLDIQTSINSDKETTIKIYEKDIKDKQTLVESLRKSLDDSKKINTSLSARLDDTGAKLKDRIKSVSYLQSSIDKWKLENKTLATTLQEQVTLLKNCQSDLEEANKTIEELKKFNERIKDELRKERKCGQNSTVTVENQNARIIDLTNKLNDYEQELEQIRPLKTQQDELNIRCREYEQSLEEIGSQLREARLEVENLKENSSVFLDSQWIDSKQVKACALCQQSFSVTRRKHHCRLCGDVFCQTCSDNKMELASSAKPVRVCDTCHAILLAKFVKHSSA